MICKNCGGNYSSDELKCPYCHSPNEAALSQAKDLQHYDEDFAKTRNDLLQNGHLILLRHLTYGFCLLLTVLALLFTALTFYYEYRRDWWQKAQVSGTAHEKNLALINDYLDSKDYVRALTLAYATDPTTDAFDNYPEVQEELLLINHYTLFLYDIQSYLTHTRDLDNLSLAAYKLQLAKDIYDATPSTSRGQQLQAELCQSLDLYLIYGYCLTPEELQSLKAIEDIYDFEIEGTTDYATLIQERMATYEKNNSTS